MADSSQSKRLFSLFVKLVLPFGLWLFLFRGFLMGDVAISIDTNSNYSLVKYFLNNVRNGVLPFWDPYVGLGRPFVFMTSSGVFNPLLTPLVLVLNFLGLNYYDAYLTYLIAYFFVGLVGFYALTKTFLKDEFLAFVAYLLLLFSGVGATIFNQINMLLIFAPCVWFFYFFLNFTQSFKKAHFFGLTFCLMLMLVSYLPFYFITLFVVFLVCIICLYPNKLKPFFSELLSFSKKNIATIVICLIALIIAALPLSLYKSLDAAGDDVSPARHCNYIDINQCVEQTFYGTAEMSYQEASSGSLGWRVGFYHLFSSLDKASYAHDSLFYLPFFCYVLIFVSLFTAVHRKQIILIVTTVILFLIAVADASFFHRLLYEYVFYFRYIRNLFFFMVFLMPLLVLIAVFQLQRLLQQKMESDRAKKAAIGLISTAHAVFLLFLINQGNILVTSYLTLIGSWLFFVIYFTGILKQQKPFLLGVIVLLAILQPVQFFSAYTRNAAGFKCEVPSQHINPKFSLSRPVQDSYSRCLMFSHAPAYIDYWYTSTMQDASAQIRFSGNTARWTFLLGMKMDLDVLKNYAKNKIVLFDEVQVLDESDLSTSIETLENVFRNNENIAFVSASESESDLMKMQLQKKSNTPMPIVGESNKFKILHFDVNSLKFMTDFESPKFLVYNDSFNSRWSVKVNDRPKRIFRANMAFKGVYLPAGKNEVYFQYTRPEGEKVYYFILIFYTLFLLYTLWLLKQQAVADWRGEG